MKSVKFYKYTAAGNDFVLFDEKEIGRINFSEKEIIRICDRHFGIGADGVLIISEADEYDFDLRFFNPDGSSGMLCANGSRCAVHYAKGAEYFDGTEALFSSGGKVYSAAVIDDENVRLNLNDLEVIIKSVFVEADGVSANGFFVDSGAPHFIIDVSEFGEVEVGEINAQSLGRKFSEADYFKPGETNVDFVEIIDGKINMRTYERGVRAETLSCGTGAIAAGIIAFSVYGLAAPIDVETPGGKAVVDYNSENGSVSLTGKVELIFEGKIFI